MFVFFKKLLILILFFVLILFSSKIILKRIKKYILLKKIERLDLKITPKDTAFAFDLHQVVLDVDVKNLIKIIFKNFSFDLFYFLFKKETYYYMYNILAKKMLLDQAYDELTEKYPNFINLKKLLIDLINAQKLDHEMVEIIKYLKNCGYSCFIVSNIWKPAYEKLQKKFNVLNKIFDGHYIPYKLDGKYLHKPKKDFYENFKKLIFSRGFKQIIFIDNSLKNIEYANKVKIIGIPFYSAEYLIELLNKWNIECKNNVKN